ncbi:type VI secretion system contractile sheath large subunit [Marimonas sp. MJW-29]|uniref:Type VI secretion system contractile sheath large subunit n=1 Tax=Sulfitobacter sediminis TaxID=3234186 RepID=A0ABV3RSY3_9RHOB
MPEDDGTDDIFAAIEAPDIAEEKDASDAVLAGIEPVTTVGEPDGTDDALASLEAPEAPEQTETADDILASIEAPEDITSTDDVLSSIEAVEEPEEETDDLDAALAGLEAPEEIAEDDGIDDILPGIESDETPEPEDDAEDILAGIEVPEPQEETVDVDALLADIETPETVEPEERAEDVLASIEPVSETAEETDDLDALLAGIETPEETALENDNDDILASLEPVTEPEKEVDDLDALLADIEVPEEDISEDNTDDVLASLEPVAETEEETDDLDALLADIETPEETNDTLDMEATPAGIEAVEETPEPAATDDLDALLADLETPAETEPEDDTDDVLASLEPVAETEEETDDLDALLADIGVTEDAPEETGATSTGAESGTVEDILAELEPEPVAEPQSEPDDLDALLADLGTEDMPQAEASDDLDSVLADLDPEPLASDTETVQDDAGDDLDALLADIGGDDATASTDPAEDDLDALLSGLDGEPDIADPPGDPSDDPETFLADFDPAATSAPASEPETDPADDLDALLAGLDDGEESAAPAEVGDDLDALLADLDSDTPAAGEDDLDALLAGLEDEPATAAGDDLDAPPETPAAPAAAATAESVEPELAFGTMSSDRPDAQKLNRKRFRLAILGDFTGRAARGQIEVGDALASRAPILLDPDTVEEVIEGFGTTLILPIGKDGAGVEVKLGGLDDLHPDELYEKVGLFSALRDLKTQLSHGGTAEQAAKTLIAWGEAHGRAVAPPRAVSGGNTVRADLKLSDFQRLIGDTGGQLKESSPIDDLLARVVGPHIRKLPDPNVTAMAEAVDEALSGAMRLILHHPEFQSVEAQWRALDLIARSIETDDTLDVMLYDVSAEEIAADLTQSDDLSQSGLARLLTEAPLDEETGRGGYSALIGMYTFEETPPHAQLLGRIARVAAHVDAPFFAAIAPGFIETPKKDRHPLVASEWDTLRAMPEAGHLGLVTPRFLMRRLYGAKTEPIYEFEFEEFTQHAGLSGMLWANPVVLVAILLARSFKENGPSMGLGEIMSLGDMPYHFITDQYGDQVALPCTERNLTLDKVETVLGRGLMPVISVKGRDDIRLGSFQSLAGGEILGPWSGVAPPPPSPPQPPKAKPETVAEEGEEDADTASIDDDLDDLLAGFDLDAADADEDQSNDDEMDAELAALLADL